MCSLSERCHFFLNAFVYLSVCLFACVFSFHFPSTSLRVRAAPYEDCKVAYVDARDVGEAMALGCLKVDMAYRTFTLFGREAVTMHQVAALLTTVSIVLPIIYLKDTKNNKKTKNKRSRRSGIASMHSHRDHHLILKFNCVFA